MSEQYTTTVDVRTTPPFQRHPRIFGAFHELKAGETMLLVNDHDPKPLFYQFQAEMPNQFTWTYIEQGPDWRVVIEKK